MDVRHMRQVAAIHRLGSFARAADDLGIAQPTLSKSIARLEDELKLTLFDRSGSGARVTPMGALLVERAERIIGEADRLARDVELVGAGEIGEARIGVGAALRSEFLPQFVEDIATRFPGLRLQVLVEARDKLVTRLLSGNLDMVILVDAADLTPQDVVKHEVFREDSIAVTSPGHPLAGRTTVSLAEFAEHPGVSSPVETGFANVVILGLEGARAANSSFFVCNDYEVARRLTIAGLATWVGPAYVVRDDLREGRLVRIDLDWRFDLTFVAAMTRAASHSPVLRQIASSAQTLGRRLVGGELASP